MEKVDLRDVVEFVLVDEGKTFDANHPMHLHGYSYRVVGMGKVWRYNHPCIEGRDGQGMALQPSLYRGLGWARYGVTTIPI